jgi:hypothetical protein
MHHILKYGDLSISRNWDLKCISQSSEKFMALMTTTSSVVIIHNFFIHNLYRL